MSEILVNGLPIAYNRCPVSYMADGMKLYFEHGVSPGSFGLALLCGDLMRSAMCADSVNRHRLFEWAYWLYNHAPSGSFGSEENVKNYIASRRKGTGK